MSPSIQAKKKNNVGPDQCVSCKSSLREKGRCTAFTWRWPRLGHFWCFVVWSVSMWALLPVNGPITERWLWPHSVMIFKENRTGQHEILQCQGRWCWPRLIRSSDSGAAGEWLVVAICLPAYVPFSGILSTVRATVFLVSGTNFRKRLIVMLYLFFSQKKSNKSM